MALADPWRTDEEHRPDKGRRIAVADRSPHLVQKTLCCRSHPRHLSVETTGDFVSAVLGLHWLYLCAIAENLKSRTVLRVKMIHARSA